MSCRTGPDVAAEDVFGLYRDEIARANAIIAATVEVPSALPDSPMVGVRLATPDETMNRRWIVLHMIEETARHPGHLDTARALLDRNGAQALRHPVHTVELSRFEQVNQLQ